MFADEVPQRVAAVSTWKSCEPLPACGGEDSFRRSRVPDLISHPKGAPEDEVRNNDGTNPPKGKIKNRKSRSKAAVVAGRRRVWNQREVTR